MKQKIGCSLRHLQVFSGKVVAWLYDFLSLSTILDPPLKCILIMSQYIVKPLY